MKFVSSQEVIEFHDRLISRDGGVAGMPEPGRADAIIHRVGRFGGRCGQLHQQDRKSVV